MDIESCAGYDHIDPFPHLFGNGEIGEEHDIVRVPSVDQLSLPSSISETLLDGAIEAIVRHHIREHGTGRSSLRQSSFVTRQTHEESDHSLEILRVHRFSSVVQETGKKRHKSFLSPFLADGREEILEIDLINPLYISGFWRQPIYTASTSQKDIVRRLVGTVFCPK